MANLVPFPKFRAFDSNGDPLAGGKLYTYEAGTATPLATYTDYGGATANTNPVVLNGDGEADVWLTAGVLYKFVLKTSADVTEWTVDDITGGGGAFTAAATVAALRGLTVGSGDRYWLQAHTTAGDGGQGVFRGVTGAAASTYVDNDGTIIVPTGGDGSAAFLRDGVDEVQIPWFGITGDGTVDDTTAVAAAIDAAEALGETVVKGRRTDIYRTTSGLTVDTDGVVFDLDGGQLLADFTSGTALTFGDGSTLRLRSYPRNLHIKTTQTGTSLHGLKMTKNVRHGTWMDKVEVQDFKGTGVEFAELNWDVQDITGLRISGCGTNLKIGTNSNAFNLVDARLIDAVTYNLDLDNVSGLNVFGGLIQGADVAGVRIEDTTAACSAINFCGTYFEDNGANHIIADGANGVTVGGCYLQCTGMTGDSLVFTNCDGIVILPNTPVNVSANNFLNVDSNCTGLQFHQQNVTLPSNQVFTGTTGLGVGFDTYIADTAALATPAPRDLGTLKRHNVGNRDTPYMAIETASATRAWYMLGRGPSRQRNATATGTLAVSNSTYNSFSYTLTGNITIAAPTGDKIDGEKITFILQQDATGSRTVTWNAVFTTAYSDTGFAANTVSSVEFTYDSDLVKWVQTGLLAWQ